MEVAVNMRKCNYIWIYTACLVFVWMGVLWASPDDCNVSGTLLIDGREAPGGTLVEAYIDDELIVSERTERDGQYELTIPRYNPANPSVKGYQDESDVITIKVDQREADPKFYARPGLQKINLEVNTTLNVRLTTWGKIKALFK